MEYCARRLAVTVAVALGACCASPPATAIAHASAKQTVMLSVRADVLATRRSWAMNNKDAKALVTSSLPRANSAISKCYKQTCVSAKKALARNLQGARWEHCIACCPLTERRASPVGWSQLAKSIHNNTR